MNILCWMRRLEKETKFAVIMFTFGLVMMFLIPTWQTPDEYTHLKYIGKTIGNENFADILAKDVGINGGRIMTHYEQKVDQKEMINALSKMPSYDKNDVLPRRMSLSILKHLPATIGILIGIVFGMPTFWVLQMGELFALAFYVFVCYYALKLVPIKKEVYTVILMMPMALQQAGGIGYDSVLLPICFFWISYVLHLKYKEEISMKEMVLLFVLWGIITYIKMPYVFLILLIFILPIEKIKLRCGKIVINGNVVKRHLGVAALGVICMSAGTFYLLRKNFWIQLVVGLLKEWKRTIYLLKATIEMWGGSILRSSVGNFGWLDTPILPSVVVIVYIVIVLLATTNGDKKNENTMTLRDRIVIWGTVSVLCLFTMFAMVNHTIMVTFYGSELAEGTYDIRTALYQIPYIGGLQGRYFLPYISLFFIPLPQLKQVKNRSVWSFVSIFETLLFGYIVYVLLARYWIG